MVMVGASAQLANGPGRIVSGRARRGLSGLGGALSAEDVYAYARSAGFDPERARMMVAIAKRESGLDPSKRCLNCVPKPGGGFFEEDSIGLWQINMRGALGQQRLSQLGLSSPSELLDPAVNASAAFALWAGNDANLNTLWSINRDSPFPYRRVYLENLAALPSAQNLENAVLARGGGGSVDERPNTAAEGEADLTGVYTALAVGAGLALAMGVLD